MKKIRVLARGAAMVCDYEALAAGSRRFIGRKHDPSLGPNGGWAALGEAQEVPAAGESGVEYVKAVKDRDLWPADEESAKHCGVKFDPEFGGEKADLLGEHKSDADADAK